MIKTVFKKLMSYLGYVVMPQGTIAMDVRQMRNFLYYNKLYQSISHQAGSIVECGVGRGRSLLYFSFLVSQENKQRKIYGFDSFEGFPEPVIEDSSKRQPKKGEWSGISPDYIRKVLQVAGIPKEFIKIDLKLIPGFFNDSLPTYDGGPIALLHIDADLYQSYKDALTMLYPKVVTNGLILFDEYKTEEWPGATKAVDEFFKDQKDKIQYDDTVKKYFLVKS